MFFTYAFPIRSILTFIYPLSHAYYVNNIKYILFAFIMHDTYKRYYSINILCTLIYHNASIALFDHIALTNTSAF